MSIPNQYLAYSSLRRAIGVIAAVSWEVVGGERLGKGRGYDSLSSILALLAGLIYVK